MTETSLISISRQILITSCLLLIAIKLVHAEENDNVNLSKIIQIQRAKIPRNSTLFKQNLRRVSPEEEDESETARFVKSRWSVWDKPEDQLAVEQKNDLMSHYMGYNGNGNEAVVGNGQVGNVRVQKSKSKPMHFYPNEAGVRSYNSGSEIGFPYPVSYNGDSSPSSRQDCNSNLQVSIFPVVLVLVAAIAGLITIVILWFIASRWTGGPSKFSSESGSGSFNSGWSSQGQGRQDEKGNALFSAFSSALQNVDFDQLTNLVLKGVEGYKNYNKQKI